MSAPRLTLPDRIRRNRWLRGGVRRLRYAWGVHKLKGPRIVKRFARLYPEAAFVQIGANDGVQLDPLRKAVLGHRWRGIMVEPVPFVFERLQRGYGHLSERIALVNAAVARESGWQPFWHLRQADPGEDMPALYDALGSFRKEVVLSHAYLIPDIEDRLVCTRVPCLTFAELLEREGFTDVDLVQMDTEGYDFEIIRSIDFDRYRPKLLVYEHYHFDPETRAECRKLLQERGYALHEEGLDTWCLQTRHVADERHREMAEFWRRVVG